MAKQDRSSVMQQLVCLGNLCAQLVYAQNLTVMNACILDKHLALQWSDSAGDIVQSNSIALETCTTAWRD